MSVRIRPLVVLTILGLLLTPPALGQPKALPRAPGATLPAGNPPPIGDPVVFLMFLRYHASMLKDIEKLEVNGSTSQPLRHSAALSMKLSDADFDSINPVYTVAKSELDALDAEGIAYRDQVISGRQKPDTKMLQQFEARRNEIAARARAKLQRTLSPEGWKALNAYIEGEFRLGITRRPLQ